MAMTLTMTMTITALTPETQPNNNNEHNNNLQLKVLVAQLLVWNHKRSEINRIQAEDKLLYSTLLCLLVFPGTDEERVINALLIR